MKTMIRRSLAGLTLMLMLLMCACGASSTGSQSPSGEQETYTIRFALDETVNSTQDIYAKKFKELVEAKSEGRMKLDIYYLGQLGDGSNQGELIQNGAIEFGFVSCGAIGNIVPEANIFSMGYVFPNTLEKVKKFLYNSEVINKTVVEAFASKNLHVIDWLDEGFMQWTNSVRPITSTADMKGLKMRVMSSPIITATYKAYGADPVTIPIAELYSALQLNMAEGQLNAVEYIENMKFYEVQKYLTLANSDVYVAALMFNMDYWNKLPEDLQNIFLEAVQETRPYYTEEHFKLIDASVVNLQEYGLEVNELDEATMAEFKALAQNAVSSFYDVGGANAEQLYKDFVAEAETYN